MIKFFETYWMWFFIGFAIMYVFQQILAKMPDEDITIMDDDLYLKREGTLEDDEI